MTFFIDLNKVTPIDNVVVIKDDDIINQTADMIYSYVLTTNTLINFNEYGKPLKYYGDLTFKCDLSMDKIQELDVYILDMKHNDYDRLNPIIEKLREFRDNEPLEFQEDLKNITILKNDDEIIEFYLDLFFEPELSSEAKTELINKGIIDVNVCLDCIKNDYPVYEHNSYEDNFTVIFRGE